MVNPINRPTIYDINDVSPHIECEGPGGNRHVIPLSLLRDIRDGTMPLERCEEWQPMVRALIGALVWYIESEREMEEWI